MFLFPSLATIFFDPANHARRTTPVNYFTVRRSVLEISIRIRRMLGTVSRWRLTNVAGVEKDVAVKLDYLYRFRNVSSLSLSLSFSLRSFLARRGMHEDGETWIPDLR